MLVFVHEFGHFIVAKKNGIRVDEFAIGFPPKIWGFRKGETDYALNLIPFGGYVKIFGENPDEESLDTNATNSFVNKSKLVQAGVLVAGVTFNILFAWILFSISFMSGFPSVMTADTQKHISNVSVVITDVIEESPAKEAGLQGGDKIVFLQSGEKNMGGSFAVSDVQDFIKNETSGELTLTYERKGETLSTTLTPESGIVSDQLAIGVAMDTIGILQLPLHLAIWEGLQTTVGMIRDIAVGLAGFIAQIFTGKADLNSVAGPVGIVSLVDDASQFGFVYLLGFTAFISLNLAVLNLIPFPALDGGRLLFILIEVITRKPINTKIANIVNATGFALLILLMIVITVSDVIKLF